MARKQKKGFSYFTLDVSFSDSIRLATIEAGNNAIPILIELWQKIYGSHGYYIDFKDDHKLLFISSALTKISIDELEKIINVFFKRGIFSKEHYEKYGILTSDSIQERFIDSCIVAKRQNILMFSEYVCCDLSQFETEKIYLRSINDDFSGVNIENSCDNDNNSGNIPENSGKIQNNSGKSTQKIDRIERIDSNRKNSGNKNNLKMPLTFSQIIDELKTESTNKNLIISQYKTTNKVIDEYINWFQFQYAPTDENELFEYDEKIVHFKNFLKNNWNKMPNIIQQQKKSNITILNQLPKND